jgi:hypothetical protein
VQLLQDVQSFQGEAKQKDTKLLSNLVTEKKNSKGKKTRRARRESLRSGKMKAPSSSMRSARRESLDIDVEAVAKEADVNAKMPMSVRSGKMNVPSGILDIDEEAIIKDSPAAIVSTKVHPVSDTEKDTIRVEETKKGAGRQSPSDDIGSNDVALVPGKAQRKGKSVFKNFPTSLSKALRRFSHTDHNEIERTRRLILKHEPHPYLLHPEGERYALWSKVVAALLMYTLSVTVIEVCFIEPPTSLKDPWLVTSLVVDFLFLCDILITFRVPFQHVVCNPPLPSRPPFPLSSPPLRYCSTPPARPFHLSLIPLSLLCPSLTPIPPPLVITPARQDARQVNIAGKALYCKDPLKIAVRYFRGWFPIDVLTTFPFQLVPFFGTDKHGSNGSFNGSDGLGVVKALRILRLVKLVRLLKSSALLQKVENRLISDLGMPWAYYR